MCMRIALLCCSVMSVVNVVCIHHADDDNSVLGCNVCSTSYGTAAFWSIMDEKDASNRNPKSL